MPSAGGSMYLSKCPLEWTLNDRQKCDLDMLLSGAFAPLNGYLTKENYDSVVNNMRLVSGEVWPMPIVLPIPKDVFIENNNNNNNILLRDELGSPMAKIIISDIYEPDLLLECEKVYGTTDDNHPYVKYVLENYKDCLYIGGKVVPLEGVIHFDFLELRDTPTQVCEYLKKNKHECVVGFQTRNPMHRSHFELTRQALNEAEINSKKKPFLLLTPAVGPTQPGDIEYHVRVRCYKKILKYYGHDNVKLVLLPLAMRMAGPKEAIWHALIRKNYGCNYFIVGRDHAGPSSKKKDGSSFYGPYDAHEAIKSVAGEIGINSVLGTEMVYVGEKDGGYLQRSNVKDGMKMMNISGTELRRRLNDREEIPEWYSYPDVVEELRRHFKADHESGVCVYLTGLPCAGKSTLATALQAQILEDERESRKITLLDADVIRTHLSKGLGFSKQDRSANVQRIGYVASEIVKHGGICLVANIAPYAADREYNKKLIQENGNYVEIYVSTSVEECERRDVKGLYKKAREGVIKQFTGLFRISYFIT
eukprot:GHVL01001251.1.p1 GENE.GHVL01001251.1~~GHVL01001251.1.p1  ORF type:complete len:534 (+),score=102.49 GHVL01001251.1:96-1697(+)